MEIKISTKHILLVLQVLSWIVFIGLCIDAGGILFNAFFTLFLNPENVKNFWEGSAYLSALYQYDRGHFIVIVSIMIIVAILKAIMFYLIIKLFVDKKLKLSNPFSPGLRKFILIQSCLALGIGLFSQYGYEYSMWLTKQGLQAPDLQSLHIAGADVWIFMAIMLFLIVQVVKRGIEIQTENDLTI